MMWQKKLKGYMRDNRFLNKVFILVSGTVLAQGLQGIFSPVLTRLYNPDDFGLLTIFISIVVISSKTVNLCYYLAIPIPKRDDEALNIVALSLLLTTVGTLVISSFLWVIKDSLLSILQAEGLRDFIWIIGMSVLGIGVYQTLNQWAVRQQAYKTITLTKMNQSIVQLSIQLGFGFLQFGRMGLLLGDALGRMGGNGLFLSLIWKKQKNNLHKVSAKKMWQLAKKYRRFPLYSTFSYLLNGTALHITPLIIAMLYGTSVAGFWSLSERVFGGPMGLIGMAVAQVFLGEGSKFMREDPKKFQTLFDQTAKKLVMWGTIPTIVLLVFSPMLLEPVFGEAWKGAGRYVQILSVAYLAQLTMSPLSQTLDILEKQDWKMGWDIIRTGVIVIGLSISAYLKLSPIYAVLIYSIVMIFSYVFMYFLCKLAISQYVKQSKEKTK